MSRFHHTDLLGSLGVLTDAAQNSTDTRTFDAFGVPTGRFGGTLTPFEWGGAGGYQKDFTTGLTLMGHRYYDASIGRFLSRAPARSGSNWYAYADNNPVTNLDPLGLQSEGGIKVSGKDPVTYVSAAVFSAFVVGPQKIVNTITGWLGLGGGKTIKAAERSAIAVKNLGASAYAAYQGERASWLPEEKMLFDMVVFQGGGVGFTGAKGVATVAVRVPRLWQITPAGTSAVRLHGRFGKMYQNASSQLWWSKDTAGHGGSAWKVFEQKGGSLHWIADADEFGQYIGGKHKGPTGLVIPLKELSSSDF